MQTQKRENFPPELAEECRFFALRGKNKAAVPEAWNDPDNWSDLDDIPESNWIGFAIGNGTNYLMIDGDHVIDPGSGKVVAWVGQLLKRLYAICPGLYVEKSQSGTGLHAFADLGDFADDFEKETNSDFQKIINMDPVKYHAMPQEERDKVPKVELFYHASGRYVLLTGDRISRGERIATGESAAAIFTELIATREAFHKQYGYGGETSATEGSPKHEVSERDRARILEALPYISAREREQWVTIGIALCNCGIPFEVWDEWSQWDDQRAGKRCDKYDPKDAARVWKSFTHTKSRWNEGTIFMLAHASGWKEIVRAGDEKRKLTMISAYDLGQKDLPETYYAIKGLVPEGETVLAAPPKSGKSWMVLQMCLAVATGGRFLDFETTQSDVVYLALEDGDKFEQERLLKQLPDRKRLPKNFHFVFSDVVPLDEGFLDQLDSLREACSNLRFVVIDTLSFVQYGKRKNESAYSSDYRTGKALKAWGDQYGIAVLVVTHTTKLVHPDDALANVTGTNGTTGAADSVLVIAKEKRSDTRAVLAVDGRRVRQAEHEIMIDWDTCKWRYVGLSDPEERERIERERKEAALLAGATYHAALEIANHETDGWKGRARDFINKATEYGIFITESPKTVGGILYGNIPLFAKAGIKIEVVKNGNASNLYKISCWKPGGEYVPEEIDV